MQNPSFWFYATNCVKCRKPSFLMHCLPAGPHLALGGELSPLLKITFSLQNPSYWWELAYARTPFNVKPVIPSQLEIFLQKTLESHIMQIPYRTFSIIVSLKIQLFKNWKLWTNRKYFLNWHGAVVWAKTKEEKVTPGRRIWNVIFFHDMNLFYLFFTEDRRVFCLGRNACLIVPGQGMKKQHSFSPARKLLWTSQGSFPLKNPVLGLPVLHLLQRSSTLQWTSSKSLPRSCAVFNWPPDFGIEWKAPNPFKQRVFA